MKKLMVLVMMLGFLTIGSSVFAECPDLTYEPQYASQCIDGYMWMMRIDKIENCVVYTVPVAQQWEVIRGRYGKIVNVVPQACTEK